MPPPRSRRERPRGRAPARTVRLSGRTPSPSGSGRRTDPGRRFVGGRAGGGDRQGAVPPSPVAHPVAARRTWRSCSRGWRIVPGSLRRGRPAGAAARDLPRRLRRLRRGALHRLGARDRPVAAQLFARRCRLAVGLGVLFAAIGAVAANGGPGNDRLIGGPRTTDLRAAAGAEPRGGPDVHVLTACGDREGARGRPRPAPTSSTAALPGRRRRRPPEEEPAIQRRGCRQALRPPTPGAPVWPVRITGPIWVAAPPVSAAGGHGAIAAVTNGLVRGRVESRAAAAANRRLAKAAAALTAVCRLGSPARSSACPEMG